MKTVKFFTLGCKVNQYDTQSIRQRFIRAGFKELTNGLPADIYLVNTCTVTQNADRRSYQLIKSIRKENSSAKIIVTGCLAEKDVSSLSRIKEIDFIVAKRFFPDRIDDFSGHTRAFLKIQDGCNNFCSYCKVSYVRGRSRSRPTHEIIDEAKRLIKRGFKEIVLCGICLGAYGNDLIPQSSLIEIIKELESIDGVLRIRLSSIEPKDINSRLIEIIKNSDKLCHHLHIPFQSGDNRILRMMNRNYTREDYLILISKIRKNIPDIAITTDVLVGFPTETDENFKNTAVLIAEIRPLKTHIFSYSRREGTQASRYRKEELPLKIIKQRSCFLKGIAQNSSLIYRGQFLNKDIDVLIERLSKRHSGFYEGRTDTYMKILVKSNDNLKNQLIKVHLLQLVDDAIVAQHNIA